MITQHIEEQMEKVLSTAMGLMISTLFGANVANHVNSFFPSPRIMDFFIELISKATIAMVSGVLTYLAIHNIKKIFKHKI